MRMLVLGASGGCGRWVTRLAHAEGHEVTALVRSGTRFAGPDGVDVRVGSAIDVADVASAMAHQEVVISCIGPQRVHPRNPWSPLRPPLGVAERSARTVISALRDSNVRRLVAISAAGVGESLARTTPFMRWLIAHSTIGEMYADLNRMERVLEASDVDWIAVRPVTLVEAGPSRRTKLVQYYRAYSIVGRADVAGWLLRAAVDPEPSTRTPMISWW